MTTEMQHALDQLQLIESLGVHIPPKSREAIITALLNGAYDITVGGVRIEIGDMIPADTAIAEAWDKPVFGL